MTTTTTTTPTPQRRPGPHPGGDRGLHPPVRRRPRRRRPRRDRGARRQARALPALADLGPSTPDELAAATGCDDRYLREWLLRPGRERLRELRRRRAVGSHLDAAQAACLADETAPTFLAGGMAVVVVDAPRRGRRPRGLPHRRGRRLAPAPPRPLHRHRAVLPPRLRRQPDRLVDPGDRRPRRRRCGRRHPGRRRRLRPRRVDDPAGRGLPRSRRSSASTTTRPRSRSPGSGPPRPGVDDRVRFEVAAADDLPRATGYDLVCIFDALHDMGDPDRGRRPHPPVARRRRRVPARRAERRTTASRTTSTSSGGSSTRRRFTVPGHLTPQEAGSLASRANVPRLVLNHIYPSGDDVDLVAECRHTLPRER